MDYIGGYQENKKILLSEAACHRALIYSKEHHVVEHEVCSNYALWVKKGPTLGIMFCI